MKKYIILILAALLLFGCADSGSSEKTESAAVTITPPAVDEPESAPTVAINKSQISLGESIIVSLTAESSYTVYVNFLGAGVNQTETLNNESKSVEIFPTESGDIKITAYSTEIDFSVSFSVAVTVDEVPETPPSEPDATADTESGIKLALIANGTLYFYDGEFNAQPNANPVHCGNRCYMDSQYKNSYSESGSIDSTLELSNQYDFITGDWQIIKIDSSTAFSLGGQAREYTDIYYQDSQVGHWSSNQWECSGIIKSMSGAYVAIDTNGNYHPLSETLNNLNYADDLLIYNYNSTNRVSTIKTDSEYSVSWSTNYFNSAKQWLEQDGVFYSWNGYTFDGTLTEQANAMWGWNATPYPISTNEAPVVIAAGVYGKIFWIECNTGWLFSYDAETDTITQEMRLYDGDGYRATGINQAATLKPKIIDGVLYYHYSGSIWSIALDTGISQLFFSGEGVVYEW